MHERRLQREGCRAIAGTDEVGRGALFGAVFAAAVILDPARPVRNLNDSKLLPPERREVLARRIQERALAWAVASATPEEIDTVNILQASRLAMKRAVEALAISVDHLLVDAISVDLPVPQTPLIHGDALSISIAAASILAKVHRDREMCRLAEEFPAYGLQRNKGYGTEEHRVALHEHGATVLHRFSFEPVRLCARGLCPERWGRFQLELFAGGDACLTT